jgi:glutaminase
MHSCFINLNLKQTQVNRLQFVSFNLLKNNAVFVNFEKIITQVYNEVSSIEDKGLLPTYIPELKNVSVNKFGVFISSVDGFKFGLGDCYERFSIQSIAKVLAVTFAYRILGEEIWDRVGVEPSGTSFNSLVQLEADLGIPRNPLINAGAIVIADILLTQLKDAKADFLEFVRSVSGNVDIHYSPIIAASEKQVGFKNIALCNLIKSFGNIKNDPNVVLDFYFNLCSIELNCKEVSDLFLFLANDGNTISGNEILTKSQSKRMNALMQTCGFYDESGEFAFKVGLPGKSGVGGGIVAVHPENYAIVVWSPRLNKKGNSYKGMKFLEEFTTATELSIF